MTPELFKNIRHLQIYTTQLAKDVLAGLYRSAFKGRGMEFEEVREYQPGDEIRSIDWNVTARMNHPFVKVFREERELTVMLLVDISASQKFGSDQKLKRQLVAEIAGVLAFTTLKNNDKLGLILFSDRVEKYIPPRTSQRHILRVIRELLVHETTEKGTNIAEALSYLGRVQTKSSICFLISDFISEDYSHQALLTSQHHDLISICVTDPYEIELPKIHLMNVEDLENKQTAVIDTSNNLVREQQREAAEERISNNKKLMDNMGAGFIDIRTDKPYLPILRKFFQLRSERRK